MLTISLSTGDDPRPLDRSPINDLDTKILDRRLELATWLFVGLGVALRLARYAMNYPLWWDEAFVAVNLIRRDYLDLSRPLDYGQVCPILFLWFELTLVKILGFSEWSLRLFPLFCSVASVFLFHQVARRAVRGAALLLAVAIFATSYHPILHAADVKPYASDLLAALVLLAAVLEWRRSPARSLWIWVLAAVAPIAIALSHPAIFVAAGGIVVLAPAVVRSRCRRVGGAYLVYVFSTLGSFAILYCLFTRPGDGKPGPHAGAMGGRFSAVARFSGASQMACAGAYRQHVRLSVRRRERSE